MLHEGGKNKGLLFLLSMQYFAILWSIKEGWLNSAEGRLLWDAQLLANNTDSYPDI